MNHIKAMSKGTHYQGKFYHRDGSFFAIHNDPSLDGTEFPFINDDQLELKQIFSGQNFDSDNGKSIEFDLRKKFLDKEVVIEAKMIWAKESYDLADIIAAVNYGFNYRDNSQHAGEVPIGNTLQWLMARKKLTQVPKSWMKYKNQN